MKSRRRRAGVLAALPFLLLAGCSERDRSPSERDGRPVLRVASYDFIENQTLAQVYAQALERAGFPAEVVDGIGTREVVEPALEQSRVDVVIDYLGTMLSFLDPGSSQTHGTPATVSAALRPLLAARGITLMQHSSAEDKNAFAVTVEFRRQHGLTRLSDLASIAGSMTLGGPPECSSRRYCLLGLKDKYGLNFGSFLPVASRSATVVALKSGEIDIGLLETTDARLSLGELVLLDDDRGLQPRENVVPLVRSAVLRSGGEAMQRVLDAVSASLTTTELIGLNRAVEVDGASSVDAAADWLRRHPVL